jgi:hypothetical protein
MTKAQLQERLDKVRLAKMEAIAQVNALLGREAELTELLAGLEKEPPVG